MPAAARATKTPAAISSERALPELGVTEIVLANGIRVLMKPTGFKNDEVLFTSWSPGGAVRPSLPVLLSVEGRRCVVVGAGCVARRKVASLLDCGALVTVIAPLAASELRQRAERGEIEWHARPYRRGDLCDAFLAIAATDSRAPGSSNR